MAPLIPILLRALPLLARIGGAGARAAAARGAAGAGARRVAAGQGKKQAGSMLQRIASAFGGQSGGTAAQGAARAGAPNPIRQRLAAFGRRSIVRRFVRYLPPPKTKSGRGRRFSGRIQYAAAKMGRNLLVPAHIPQRHPGQPGGPQGPPLPPPPGAQGGPQGPPPPPQGGHTQQNALGWLGKFGKALGGATSMAFKITVGLGAFALATEKLTRLLAEQRRELAPYSGQIAGAFAKLDLQDISMKRRFAQDTAGTSTMLVNAVHRQRESTVKIHEDLMILNNLVGTTKAILGTGAGEVYKAARIVLGFGPILDLIEKNTRKEGGEMSPADKFVQGLLNPNFAGQKPAPDQLPPLK